MPDNLNQSNEEQVENQSEDVKNIDLISESEKQWIKNVEESLAHEEVEIPLEDGEHRSPEPEPASDAASNLSDDLTEENEVRVDDEQGDDELTEEEKKLKEEALEEVTAPNIKGIVEAILFVSDEPVSIDRFRVALGARTKPQIIRDIIGELRDEYNTDDRGYMIIEVASGYQMATRPQYAHWLNKIHKGKKSRYLSKSSLETLSIVSYRQPIIRAEIEAIRGVNVDGVLKTLLERNLIKIVGKKEVPGRPMLFGTTKKFLEYFGLNSLDELPKLPDIKPEDEAKILETIRAGAQIDSENQGMREDQPIVEDYQETLRDTENEINTEDH